uniref:Immunoglobulin V-set domain-containing protein n=1 Tax=Pavo cristatus TaxID=9049 RepID=A0A8C9FQU6_PAVCR
FLLQIPSTLHAVFIGMYGERRIAAREQIRTVDRSLYPPGYTGENAVSLLHCNFSTSSSVFYIFWYQQHLTQSPQLLLWVNAFRPHMSSGRFSSVLSMENSHVLLHVQDVRFQHRAVYFCALSTHWCLQRAAAYRKVWVL